MTTQTIVQCVTVLALLFALAWPLGCYMARVYTGQARLMQRVLGPLERFLYRVSGIRAEREMSWGSMRPPFSS